MRILIVEDFNLIAESFEIVCREGGNEVVKARSGAAAFVEAEKALPDLVVLDLMLDDLDGFQIAAKLRELKPSVLILGVSSRCEARTVYRMERAGFQGFLDKRSGMLDELRNALATLGNGQKYFSKAYLEEAAKLRKDPVGFSKTLSDRQQEILTLIGDRLSDAQIADRLKLAVVTVTNHRHDIQRKLKVNTRPELVDFAIAEGFTSLSEVERRKRNKAG